MLGQILVKVQNIKFYDNPSGGLCALPCGQEDVTRPIVRFSKLLYEHPVRTMEEEKTGKATAEVDWNKEIGGRRKRNRRE